MDLATISEIIARIGKIPPVDPDKDIFEAGFASIDALDLLLELETQFDVNIADEDFVSARTPRAVFQLVHRLKMGDHA